MTTQIDLQTQAKNAAILLVAKVLLTQAQILGSGSSYPVIIPAPGAGFVINVIAATIAYNAGGPSYFTDPDHGTFALELSSGSGLTAVTPTIPNAQLLTGANSNLMMNLATNQGASALANWENLPLVFVSENPVVGGSPSDTVTIYVHYTIISIP